MKINSWISYFFFKIFTWASSWVLGKEWVTEQVRQVNKEPVLCLILALARPPAPPQAILAAGSAASS